ncbi:RDD family protein [Dyella tabacisoli]|uniref:RDD family protein n=1 Tax=Dyella tabacisoli TaxID=2282381 RepID=A0A369UMN4_9GAMM|nr:RDD family protein [Dyella tabacisoli]RDD81747.1 RDD family protein [Dyella tabacisoli]
MDTVHGEGESILDLAGFWRRLGAFAIDCVLLGMVGSILGQLLFGQLARLGGYGTWLGFAIALAYFGICNSRINGGQTFGKKVLSVRVVDVHGQLLSLSRSLCRYTVLGLPFFLNGMSIDPQRPMPWLVYLVALIFIGGGLSIIYLYIFNRRTRQSLHDLAVGSYVVRVEPRLPVKPLASLWQGHFVVLALLAVAGLAAPVVGERVSHSQGLAGLLPAYSLLLKQPHVVNVMVTNGWVSMNGQAARHYLSAQLVLDTSQIDYDVLANNAAHLMAANYPDIASKDAVVVDLIYGYNIGISSARKVHRYSFTPQELR